jgi:hypothetical protein
MSEWVDDDDYPTDAMLDKIEKWTGDYKELMQFIEPHWQYGKSGYWSEDGMEYKISTAGWSGNEDILRALQENYTFWSLCWVQSRRGGHYIFEVKE